MKLIKMIADSDICGVNDISNATPRKAVRAILFDDKKLMALLYITKYNLFTVPGGGIEANENIIDALKREILEETGCKCVIEHELGYIYESRNSHNFTQESYYYIATVIGEKGSPTMTQEEIDEGTELQWHTIDDSLKILSNVTHNDYRCKYIQCRDIAVLTEAISVLRTK